MKRYLIGFLVFALSGLLILPGCGIFNLSGETGFGGIRVSTDIPQEYLEKVEGLDASSLKNIIISVSRESDLYAQFVEIEGSNNGEEVLFGEMKSGTWEARVEVEDEEGHTVLAGSKKARIDANGITEVFVNIDLVPSRVKFEITLPQGDYSSGQLILKGADGKTRSEDFNLHHNYGEVEIPQLDPQDWEVGLEIRDANGDEKFYGYSPEVFRLYPGLQGTAYVDLPGIFSDISISTNWKTSPEAVRGLEGTQEEEGFLLTWSRVNSDEIVGYRVFRGAEEDGVKKALNGELIDENEFLDDDIRGGQEYYYWVVAYLDNGYSSPVGDAYRVFIEIVEGVLGQISVKHSFPPPVLSRQNDYSSGQEVKGSFMQEGPLDESIPGEFIVGFSSVAVLSDVQAQVETMGVEIVDKNRSLNALLVRVDEGEVQAATGDLMNIAGVRYVEPNYRVQALASVPNDPRYSQQWHYPLIRLPQAWSITTGSNRVRVAVLDTGCDADHPDLGPRLDTAGGYNFIDNNDNTQDINGHGTHVAGTIGAVTDNNQGVAGVMWAGEILPVKVLGDDGGGTYWTVGNGMLYAAGILDDEEYPANPNPVDVINLSLGGDNSSQFLEEVARDVYAAGVIMVAAAGNTGGSVGYPAAFPEVIAVGALDHQKTKDNNEITLTSYSSRGPQLDILAPGGIPAEGVLSTVPGDGYSSKMGTSMAAPHVAGIVGLMLSEGIPAREVREIIKNTSTVFGQEISSLAGGGAPPGNGNEIEEGVGLINAYWAVSGVEEIKILLGNRSGDTINTVAETTINLEGGGYGFSEPPPGEYRVYAWIDVRGNGKIEKGDYFAESEEIVFSGGEIISVNLTLEEIVD